MLDLYTVAAIHKYARLIAQRRAETGRSGKSRQPRQTVIAGGNIFALVDVRARDEETIDILCLHDAAQGRQSGGAVFGARAHGEVLKH